MMFINEMSNSALLVLRLILGSVFIVHGLPKLKGSKKMAEMMGKPNMASAFMLLGICELLGGLASIGGFLTQIAAIGLGIIMIGAIVMKIKKWHVAFTAHDKTGWEFDATLLAIALALFFMGAGSFSIDSIIGFWP